MIRIVLDRKTTVNFFLSKKKRKEKINPSADYNKWTRKKIQFPLSKKYEYEFISDDHMSWSRPK